MSSRKNYIVVTDQRGVTTNEILMKLRYTGYQPAGQANFVQANESDDLFIGTYDGNAIIVHPDLTDDFFYRRPSDTEKKFVAAFSSSQIIALAENNDERKFGFAIIDKGQRKRVMHGHEEKIIADIGEEIPEEKTVKDGEIWTEVELDQMWSDNDEWMVMELYAFEAGMRTPAEISKRFFGETIDNLDTDTVKLTRYKKVHIGANNIDTGRIDENQLPEKDNESQPSTPSGVDAPTSLVEISEGTSLDSVGEIGLEEAMQQSPSEGLQFTPEIINNLPLPLREILEICITEKERSHMFSTLLATTACAMPNVQGTYGGKRVSPNIYVMNLGLFGTGKSLQSFAGILLTPIVEQLNAEQKQDENQYQIDLAAYEEAKKAGEDCEKPVPPPIKRLIVAGNITKTLLITRIADNPHGIIIIEVEGDTIVTANKIDSNNYMDVLRAAYGNETISVERKGGELSLRVNRPVVCFLVSMTYNQLYKLIPDTEDGMYSRIAFTNLPITDVFEDMFDEGRDNYEERMNEKGKILLHVFNLLRGRSIDRPVMVKLGNNEQRKKFKTTFQKYKSEYMENLSLEHGGLVNRLGLLAFKVLMVLSIYRNYDGNFGDIDDTVLATNEDFENMLRIVEVFRRNSLYVQGMMPKPKNGNSSDKPEQLEGKAEQMRRAKELLNNGMSYSKIAIEILGDIKHKGTIFRWLNTK